ncbi:glutamate receptor ionotropic, delta-1-like [Babylonia areolata]|uniref:glutamate receptor ionotropic, delta-1-like n=1 Tax=Babylonia areolata TaxID=304850 RepID=UPI003FD3CF4B
MTGMLHRKEADFALSGMSLSAERASVSDHTRGFYFDELVLVTRFPDSTQVGWTFFIRPFDWLVFLLLGCGLVLMTVVLALMDRWFVRAHRGSWTMGREKGKRAPLMFSSLTQSAEVLFGSLLGRAVDYNGASTSGRVLLVAWLLMSLVTVATYTGKLTSYSVITKQPLPFRTLEELVKRSDYTWGVTKGTSMEDFLRNSTNKDYQLFYRKMLEFEESDPHIRSNDIDFSVTKILRENYVRLTSESFYKYRKTQHCRLTMAQERLSQDTLVVYLQKGSPFTQLFDETIAQVTETGLMEHLTRKWFPEQKDCDGDETQVMSVSLELVPVAFLLAAGGLTLASGTLLLEFLTRNNRGRR